MSKLVSFNKEKFENGFKTAVRAVSCTLGPLGKNIYLADPVLPRFTNDGASIANKIVLEDPEEDAGAWVIRSATAKTADEVGDQTTTTAVIAGALFEAIKKINAPAVEVRRELNKLLPEIASEISSYSHKTTPKEIKHIARVSSENEELANLITKIFEKKGSDAHVLVEDSSTAVSSVEMKDGYEAKVGFMSPWLVTNAQKQNAEYHEVPVLCSKKKIDSITQLLPLFEKLSEKKVTKLVIVCEEMDIAALGTIVDNKRRGTFSTLVIRATGDLLEDIAAVVGATVISEGTGSDFSDGDILKKCGVASSVVSTFGMPPLSGVTTFIGKGNSGRAHASLLDAQAENSKNDIEKGSLKKRAARLRSGIAVLRIGAISEQERGYLRDKADDAVRAVKSALEEGYIEGGGMVLHRISQKIDRPIIFNSELASRHNKSLLVGGVISVPDGMLKGKMQKSNEIGRSLMKVALAAPLKTIIENSGGDYAEVVRSMPKNKGYDAKEGEYKDLIAAGIIDPAKGARIAVESAVSSVGEMIQVEGLVVDVKERV